MAVGTPTTLGNTVVGGTPGTLPHVTTAAVTSGDSIIVGVYIPSATTTLVSVTDTAGNVYTIDHQYKHSAQPRRVCLASCHGAIALPLGGTITATMSAVTSGTKGICALTCAGIRGNATALDQTGEAEGSSATWSSGASGVLERADELAVAFAASASGTASTTDAGFTELEDFNTQRNLLAYKQCVDTTSVTASGTWANAVWVGVIATYKGLTPGGAGGVYTGGSPYIYPGPYGTPVC